MTTPMADPGQSDASEISARHPRLPSSAGKEDLHSALMDKLGLAIVTKEFPPHSLIHMTDLEEHYGVSRSVVREVIRVLSSMGMVASKRRLGTVVQPEHEWNLFDAAVIRWRLASDQRLEQLKSLSDLRVAIEPHAARLAAQQATLPAASELVSLSARMWAAAQVGNGEEFLELDIAFHSLVLETSGNAMFSQLHTLVTEILVGRTERGLMPLTPNHEALQFHQDVAKAIQHGDSDAAYSAMAKIVEQSVEETYDIWEQTHLGPAE
ncbi:FadR/GntR family transcriptional regulator [Arthrobacter psychrolactophilus]